MHQSSKLFSINRTLLVELYSNAFISRNFFTDRVIYSYQELVVPDAQFRLYQKNLKRG